MNTIHIEATGNANVMKFVADYTLIPGGVELHRDSDISEIPMAQELFKLPFVSMIFITANFVAIEKTNDVEWDMVAESLKELISDELLANPRVYRQITKKEVFPLYAEMTPNPSVMKFVSPKLILDGFVEATSIEEAQDIPLAKAVYKQFDFITNVFISDNFVAITKNNSVEWHEVMNPVRSFVAEYLQNGGVVSEKEPQKHENPVKKIINREYSDDEQKIADIIAEYVSSAVENDGGKISLIEYDAETKTAKMLMQGACSGCPSSTITLKNGIENLLKQFVPELVENVEAVNE